ncbi:hypothetical protein D0B54_00240 [Solimonas sp. K1W22B-7]|nr:hypothetical protein D0B54_00240 [Solimonas sp. K1W22B-7]
MRINHPNAALHPAASNLAPGLRLPAFALAMDMPLSRPGVPGLNLTLASLPQQPPMAVVLMQMLGQPPPAHWRLRELDPAATYTPTQTDPEMPQTLSLELRLVSADGHALSARLVLSIFAAAREQAPGLVEALRKHDMSQMPGPILDRSAAELVGSRHGFEWLPDSRAQWQAQALAMRGWLQIRPRELPRKPSAYMPPAQDRPGEFDPEPLPAPPPANDDGAPTLGVGQWLWLSAKSFGSWLKAYW